MTFEVNFDGLVGPTHNYSGLSFGNVASMTHARTVSSPREAALQGLEKMRYLMRLGIKQAILPPQLRPRLDALRAVGFQGNDVELLQTVPIEMLAQVYSASSMWTANAATVCPSADSSDGKVHITPANLASSFHRTLEVSATTVVLRQIFADEKWFTVHDPLPFSSLFADEGAANHIRLTRAHGQQGVQVFAFGKPGERFPGRQSFTASQAVARLNHVKTAFFAQTSPEAIDAGVFHNDVISVGNENVFLYHDRAFLDTQKVVDGISKKLPELVCLEVSDSEVPLKDAVSSYLFNSQIVTLPTGKMALIAPIEVKENASTKACVDRIVEENNPIEEVHYLDLRQSMHNGGGPACLRLRVVLTEEQLMGMHQGVFLTEALYDSLASCIKEHYRERLSVEDLRDPELMKESAAALRALLGLLGLR